MRGAYSENSGATFSERLRSVKQAVAEPVQNAGLRVRNLTMRLRTAVERAARREHLQKQEGELPRKDLESRVAAYLEAVGFAWKVSLSSDSDRWML